MSEIPIDAVADVTPEPAYDCWVCHWRPPGEAFCGTCIQRILDAIQAEKEKKEMEYHG